MRLSLSLLITGSRSSLVRALLPTNPLKMENIPFPAPLLPDSSFNQSINQSIMHMKEINLKIIAVNIFSKIPKKWKATLKFPLFIDTLDPKISIGWYFLS